MATAEPRDFWRASPWSDLAFPGPEQAARWYAAGWWREQTFLDDLAVAARDRADHPALIAYEDGQLATSLTFAELAVLVTRFAAALTELGARHGTVVVLYLPNRWQFNVLYLACIRIGAVAAPVLPTLDARELGQVLTASQAPICVTVASGAGIDYAARLAEAAPPSLKHQVVIGEAGPARPGTVDFVDTRWEDRPLAGMAPSGPGEPSLLLYTSGTTGQMKGVVHSQNTLYASIRAETGPLGLGPGDVLCVPHFLAHMAGIYGCYMAPMLGATNVIADSNMSLTDMSLLLDLIPEHRVSYVYAAPAYARRMLDEQRRQPRDSSSLRLLVTGSAPVDPELVTATREVFGIELRALWGMTETGCTTITRADDPPGWAAHSDGRPVPWMEVRIGADEAGAVDRSGPLLVRGASLCLGYLGQPDTYAECFDQDGWFSTGDLARDDGRGGIKLAGRRSDLITRANGHKVSTLEVEAVLVTHPSVTEVVLVGYPDPDAAGAELVAAIVVPEGSPPALSDLHEHLSEARMARTLWPDRVLYARELPRGSPLGKVLRAELRERLEIAASRPR